MGVSTRRDHAYTSTLTAFILVDCSATSNGRLGIPHNHPSLAQWHASYDGINLPVQLPLENVGIVDLQANGYGFLALDTKGGVWAWGRWLVSSVRRTWSVGDRADMAYHRRQALWMAASSLRERIQTGCIAGRSRRTLESCSLAQRSRPSRVDGDTRCCWTRPAGERFEGKSAAESSDTDPDVSLSAFGSSRLGGRPSSMKGTGPRMSGASPPTLRPIRFGPRETHPSSIPLLQQSNHPDLSRMGAFVHPLCRWDRHLVVAQSEPTSDLVPPDSATKHDASDPGAGDPSDGSFSRLRARAVAVRGEDHQARFGQQLHRRPHRHGSSLDRVGRR